MPLVRFLTCGSVDDGKSTLIGRLLYDTGNIYDDHFLALEADTRRHRGVGAAIDFSLLLDGLAAEREQGITIDVAYRHFRSKHRRFIVADTPGHEQYTRNMATGASTADCAVILVDARKGVLTQTWRHSFIVSILGIRHIAIAFNKMDLVDYAEERYNDLVAEYRMMAERIGVFDFTCIPVCALRGENVALRGNVMSWYKGPTLLEYIDGVEIDQERLQSAPFRMAVQWVNRAAPDFRGVAGTISGGAIHPGDPVVIRPSGTPSRVARIVTFDGDLDRASVGQSVTLVLEDDVDAARGDIVGDPAAPPSTTDRLEATVVWMSERGLDGAQPYLIRVGTATVSGSIAASRRVDSATLDEVPASTLALNDIGICSVELDRPVAVDRYGDNRELGGFVVIDRVTFETLACGMVRSALPRRSESRGGGRRLAWVTDAGEIVELTDEERAKVSL